MNKQQVITLAERMGFYLDRDQWDEKGWLRFQLQPALDEKDLRWIWYVGEDFLADNLANVAQILFKAGQKWQQINAQRIDSLPIQY